MGLSEEKRAQIEKIYPISNGCQIIFLNRMKEILDSIKDVCNEAFDNLLNCQEIICR